MSVFRQPLLTPYSLEKGDLGGSESDGKDRLNYSLLYISALNCLYAIMLSTTALR